MNAELRLPERKTSGCRGGKIDPEKAATVLRLVARISPRLTPEQRKALARAVGDSERELVERPRSGLRLANGQIVREEQLRDLVRVLVKFVSALEPVLAGAWSRLCPTSSLRVPRHFDQQVRQFLTTERASATLLLQELAGLRLFLTALVAAAARAGDTLAERLTGSLSPEAILAEVEGENEGLLRALGALIGSSKKERCWDAYCGKSDSLGARSIKAEVHRAIAADVESFIRSMSKTSKERKE